jgi:choline-sulfatase
VISVSFRNAFVGCAIVALTWSGGHTSSPPVGIVIVTLDTTRADRLSPYGLMDSPMPALERLAREGVVFEQALSVSPLTLPAHASIFTGLLPLHHGVADNADEPLDASHATLAELLRHKGYRTGAFVGSVVLNRDRGLARGFEAYSDLTSRGSDGRPVLQRRGDAVMSDALQWLDRHGQSSFLLWVHLFDPHRPYDPPEPYLSGSADAYIGEIRFADAQIGRLLTALEQRRLLHRTTVVVAGDHGESLGEHGERDHGMSLYDAVLRVPLIIRAPGVEPHRVRDVVRLTDIMPTVLDLSSIPSPAMDGSSLRTLMSGRRESRDREVYAEARYPERFGLMPVRALRDRRFKFIDGPRPELYDLFHDPFETRNLISERPRLASAMQARIGAIRSSSPDRMPARSRVPAALRERLAALGYAGH